MINRAIGTAVSTAAAALLVMAVAPRMAVAGPLDVIIDVGETEGAPGDFVFFDVTLNTGGNEVAGTQNDIVYDNMATPIAAGKNGRPICSVNPDINKSATTFAFQPPNCEPTGGAGPIEPCTGVRALVLALDNVDPIPDGSVMYSCEVAIASDAPGNEIFPLINDNAGSSDPGGNALPTIGEDGAVTVSGGPADAIIEIGSATGAPGDFVFFDVTLDPVTPAGAGTVEVAGTQNDIGFSPETPIAADKNGRPFCSVNPDINKNATTFAFQPPGCQDKGIGLCTGVRALVLALDNVDPIPPGSVLYTCEVAISPDAAAGAGVLSFPLVCSNAQASDPEGNALSVDCIDGAIDVATEPTPTPTPPDAEVFCFLADDISAEATEIPCEEVVGEFPASGRIDILEGTELVDYDGVEVIPGNGAGNGPEIIFLNAVRGAGGTTAQSHPVGSFVELFVPPPPPTPTPPPLFGDNDSCQVVAPADSQTGWLLLVPVAALFWMRRRSRLH